MPESIENLSLSKVPKFIRVSLANDVSVSPDEAQQTLSDAAAINDFETICVLVLPSLRPDFNPTEMRWDNLRRLSQAVLLEE